MLLCATSLVCLCHLAVAVDTISSESSLDRGFSLLYNLDFAGAHQVFSTWQQQHPDDPMGPACDAAGLLFSEFNRLGVLEAQFYADDQKFAARKQLTPDGAVRDRFYAALELADSRARARLTRSPKDRDALLALTMSSGLKADYAGLIEKRNLASLHYTKEATAWAQQLLAVDPDCYDAHLATGVSQYIIGSMAAPIRWLVRLGGVSGDKQKGIADLQLTAAARTLSCALCAHPPGDRLCAGKGQNASSRVAGFLAQRVSAESSVYSGNRTPGHSDLRKPPVSPSATRGLIRNLQFCNRPVTIKTEPKK